MRLPVEPAAAGYTNVVSDRLSRRNGGLTGEALSDEPAFANDAAEQLCRREGLRSAT